MTTFVCNNCKYRCEGEKELKFCPYCGEKNSIKKEETADELLDEIGE